MIHLKKAFISEVQRLVHSATTWHSTTLVDNQLLTLMGSKAFPEAITVSVFWYIWINDNNNIRMDDVWMADGTPTKREVICEKLACDELQKEFIEWKEEARLDILAIINKASLITWDEDSDPLPPAMLH